MMKAYYFATADRKLRYGDNRPIVVGESHSVDGGLDMCGKGLHASVRLIDALKYAPGPVLYEVDLSGDMIKGEDKICARTRLYLKEIGDISDILGEFARKQAMVNIEKIKPYTDQFVLIIEFLQTGDEKLRSAARSAARSAESAAWSAAESAAWSAGSAAAAESAAWSAAAGSAAAAAESAAESAAWSAAWSAAAGSAAESAAWSDADQMLMIMIKGE